MTGWNAFRTSYDLQTNTDVAGKDTPDSVDTADVANIGLSLSAGLEPFIDNINNFVFYNGTAIPNDAIGAENDIYIQTNGGISLVIWRKTTTSWAIQTTVPLGISRQDGIVSGLRTVIIVLGSVEVTKGTWSISDNLYSKPIPTTITYDDPVVGSDRIDTIYADEFGNVLYIAGAPSGSPVKPTLPSNTIEVDSIYVPALGTGDAYLFSAGTADGIPTNPTITATQANYVSDGDGGFYIPLVGEQALPSGFVPANLAVINKSGVITYQSITLSEDGSSILGLTDNDVQKITIKLT